MKNPLLWAYLPQLLSAKSEDHTTVLENRIQQSDAGLGMLPSFSDLKNPHRRQTALVQIKNSMMALAKEKSQVTPEVVSVVAGVVATLNSTDVGSAFHAILDGHNIDINMLSTSLATAGPIQDAFTNNIGNLTNATAEVEHARGLDLDCEQKVWGLCNETVDCESGINANWTIANNQVIAADDAINSYWCDRSPPADRTTPFVRLESSQLFTTYTNALNYLDSLQSEVQNCNYKAAEADQHMHYCQVVQTSLEVAQCTLFGQVQQLEQTYHRDHQQMKLNYQNEKAQVMLRESDRKKEWEVLQRVICLLSTLTAPAHSSGIDNNNTVTEESVSACIEMFVDVSHLVIAYQAFPPLVGMPPLPQHPCTAGFAFSIPVDSDITCGTHHGTVQNYDGTGTAECYCSFTETQTSQNLTLPFYFLINAGIELNDGDWSFASNNYGSFDLSREIEGNVYTVVCVKTEPTPLTLSAGGGPSDYAYCYGDAAASVLMEDGVATNLESFIYRGGFNFMDGYYHAGINIIAPYSGQIDMMGTNAYDTYSLVFGDHVTRDISAPCFGGWHPVTQDWLHLETALQYCWQNAESDGYGVSDGCCDDGCFMYQYSDRVVCYPNIAARAVR